jgi:hypothetical protein
MNNTFYKQAPFEECDENVYNYLFSQVKELDLSRIQETVNRQIDNVACAGGICEL